MPAQHAIDVAPRDQPHPALALIAALLCVPGSTIAWELPAGGFWIGVPLAIIAIVLGLRARSVVSGGDRAMATAAVVIGTIALLFTATWMVAGALS